MQINPEDHLQYWINHLSFLLRRDVQTRFAKAGHTVSAEEWAILLMLWQQDGRTPGALANVTVKDQTTVTRLLDKMERKGLITRTSDPTDRRKSRVNLTDLANNLKPDLSALARDLMSNSEAGIAEQDKSIALQVLRKMADNLRKGA